MRLFGSHRTWLCRPIRPDGHRSRVPMWRGAMGSLGELFAVDLFYNWTCGQSGIYKFETIPFLFPKSPQCAHLARFGSLPQSQAPLVRAPRSFHLTTSHGHANLHSYQLPINGCLVHIAPHHTGRRQQPQSLSRWATTPPPSCLIFPTFPTDSGQRGSCSLPCP